MYTTLIDAETLAAHLKDPLWVILDCRFKADQSEYGRLLYESGHIPNAQYIDLDTDLSGPMTSTSGGHPLPDPNHLASRLCQMGITSDSQVVIYDDQAGAYAGRGRWCLQWLGLKNVAVLDGGLDAWSQKGFSTEQETPNIVQPATTLFKPDQNRWVTVERLEQELSKQSCLLIDARARERYLGSFDPFNPRAGHVPGAINRPFMENLLANRQFKSVAALKAEWTEILGDWKAEQVIHMCGSGVTACHNQLAMDMAGLTGSKLYVGSWSEWVLDQNRPVEKS